MFQIHIIVLVACWVILPVLSEIRYNRPRGPPPPPRPPHPPYFGKGKWPPPPPMRLPNRNHVRPIPVQMGSYKQPQIVPRPQRMPQPVAFPSAIWKTPANVYKPPVEKPFLQLPVINKPYEFINNEPALSISGPVIPALQALPTTIKQVGEKGPIHTIPAPNLSPADKPANFKEEFPHKSTYNFKEQEISFNSIQALPQTLPQALPLVQQQIPHVSQHLTVQQVPHQYQVNEFNTDAHHLPLEQPGQFGAKQTYFAPDPDPKLNGNQINVDLAALNSVVPQATSFGQPQPSILAAQHNIVSPPGILSHQELLQIINSIPSQHLVDSYGTPLMQQPQLQQHFMQQAAQSSPVTQINVLGSNQPLFQPDFANQIPDVPQSVKDNFKPQFHTFNYVEQGRQKTLPNEFQSRVTGDYALEPQPSENVQTVAVQNPNEALAQTQYVQQYFTNNEENNINDNNVEVEEQNEKEATRILSQLATEGEVAPNRFYSTLPNREAAEVLATLQAAGNVNSNIMKTIQNNEQTAMRIYVPDEEENEEMETSEEKILRDQNPVPEIKIYETTYINHTPENHKSKDSMEYEDYSSQMSQEDKSNADELYTVKNQVSFGNRIVTKKQA